MLGKEGKVVGEYQFLKYLSKDENDIETWAAINTNENNAKYRVLVASKEKLAEKEKQENFFGMKDIYMALQSDNILIPKDLIESKKNFYVIFNIGTFSQMSELIKETSLDKGFPLEEAMMYITQLVKAVHELHNSKLIHRQLSPQLIYISRADRKLMLMLSNHTKLVTDAPLETVIRVPGFIAAPDTTNAPCYTQAVDVWGIGIVAYQLLFNALPFSKDSANLRENEAEKERFSGPNLRYPGNRKQATPEHIKQFLSATINSSVNTRPSIESLLAMCQGPQPAPMNPYSMENPQNNPSPNQALPTQSRLPQEESSIGADTTARLQRRFLMEAFNTLVGESADEDLNPEGSIEIEINLRLLAFCVSKLAFLSSKKFENLHYSESMPIPMIGSISDRQYDQLLGSFRTLWNQNNKYFEKCLLNLKGEPNDMINNYSALAIKGYLPSEDLLRQWGMELLLGFYHKLHRTEDLLLLGNRPDEIDEVFRQVYAVLNLPFLDSTTDEAVKNQAKSDHDKLKKSALSTLRVKMDQKLK